MQKSKEAKRQEQRTARRFGGRRHPMSGSLWYLKEDGSSDRFLIQAKFTYGRTFTMNRRILDALLTQAAVQGRIALFEIWFKSPAGFVAQEERYYLLHAKDFELLTKAQWFRIDKTRSAAGIKLTPGGRR